MGRKELMREDERRAAAGAWQGRYMAVTRPFSSGIRGEWQEGDFGLVCSVSYSRYEWGFPCAWFETPAGRAGVVSRLRPCTEEEEAIARLGGYRLGP